MIDSYELPTNSCPIQHLEITYLRLSTQKSTLGSGGGVAECLLTFSTFRVGTYSRWALI